jgi:hypothetical protein
MLITDAWRHFDDHRTGLVDFGRQRVSDPEVEVALRRIGGTTVRTLWSFKPYVDEITDNLYAALLFAINRDSGRVRPPITMLAGGPCGDAESTKIVETELLQRSGPRCPILEAIDHGVTTHALDRASTRRATREEDHRDRSQLNESVQMVAHLLVEARPGIPA